MGSIIWFIKKKLNTVLYMHTAILQFISFEPASTIVFTMYLLYRSLIEHAFTVLYYTLLFRLRYSFVPLFFRTLFVFRNSQWEFHGTFLLSVPKSIDSQCSMEPSLFSLWVSIEDIEKDFLVETFLIEFIRFILFYHNVALLWV